MILTGKKTAESRLRNTPGEPFGCVSPGERLFLKASGGLFMGTAIAAKIQEYEDLNEAGIRKLAKQWNTRVCGSADYWQSKQTARYATMISLADVEPLDVGPAYHRQLMRAWYVLPEGASPMREYTVTAGAIRNSYVTMPDAWREAKEHEFQLEMPDGKNFTTCLARGARLRWRGIGRYYRACGVSPGDVVRFVAAGERRYVVTFSKTNQHAAS